MGKLENIVIVPDVYHSTHHSLRFLNDFNARVEMVTDILEDSIQEKNLENIKKAKEELKKYYKVTKNEMKKSDYPEIAKKFGGLIDTGYELLSNKIDDLIYLAKNDYWEIADDVLNEMYEILNLMQDNYEKRLIQVYKYFEQKMSEKKKRLKEVI